MTAQQPQCNRHPDAIWVEVFASNDPGEQRYETVCSACWEEDLYIDDMIAALEQSGAAMEMAS